MYNVYAKTDVVAKSIFVKDSQGNIHLHLRLSSPLMDPSEPRYMEPIQTQGLISPDCEVSADESLSFPSEFDNLETNFDMEFPVNDMLPSVSGNDHEE
ncbi:hypothetical protein POTOM_060760 [Populus tomentosa]|uniref:Uncharacterized protein n=1 Tax=Populus tomentosa TaxID=118781 RepID=A0A8X7XQ56_POPTO|nr:hypothetical protein POTOM_060760 [Populus tomentosa]